MARGGRVGAGEKDCEFERLSAVWTGLRLLGTVDLDIYVGCVKSSCGLKKLSSNQVCDFPTSGCPNKLPGQQT